MLAIQRRGKAGRETVPLSIRYDRLEKTHGESIPHLFARPLGARHEVLSHHYIRTLLNAAAKAAGLSYNGESIRFTPHDFRRLFTTDVVGAGLPLHIAAALLGHIDLDTTRGYTAVFQDDLIARHQQFIARRRTLRDSSEYRDITAEEWAEFEKHFQLRRVALGDCFRPYGTACVHEHACIRCPHLRLDPAQKPLLDDIEANTRLRLAEAGEKGWLGETAALEETLHHIGRKRTQLPTATPRKPTS
ncbi:MAG: site-specific integrase, partial [Actinomycetota bacterium]|nr:site-specific integrase [Actinomycetota bacterium]